MADEEGEENPRGSLAVSKLYRTCPRPLLPASGPEVWVFHGGREGIGRHVDLDAIKAHFANNVKVKAEIIVYYRLRLLLNLINSLNKYQTMFGSI